MKFLNLTEGTFPINLAFEIESLDVPNIGKLKGSIEVDLSIMRVSKNLLKSDGNIKGIFIDICQSCLKETDTYLKSKINVTLKDIDEVYSDSSDQDQTHYQDLEYFNLQHFIEEEVALNYQKNLPFKKIRDLID